MNRSSAAAFAAVLGLSFATAIGVSASSGAAQGGCDISVSSECDATSLLSVRSDLHKKGQPDELMHSRGVLDSTNEMVKQSVNLGSDRQHPIKLDEANILPAPWMDGPATAASRHAAIDHMEAQTTATMGAPVMPAPKDEPSVHGPQIVPSKDMAPVKELSKAVADIFGTKKDLSKALGVKAKAAAKVEVGKKAKPTKEHVTKEAKTKEVVARHKAGGVDPAAEAAAEVAKNKAKDLKNDAEAANVKNQNDAKDDAKAAAEVEENKAKDRKARAEDASEAEIAAKDKTNKAKDAAKAAAVVAKDKANDIIKAGEDAAEPVNKKGRAPAEPEIKKDTAEDMKDAVVAASAKMNDAKDDAKAAAVALKKKDKELTDAKDDAAAAGAKARDDAEAAEETPKRQGKVLDVDAEAAHEKVAEDAAEGVAAGHAAKIEKDTATDVKIKEITDGAKAAKNKAEDVEDAAEHQLGKAEGELDKEAKHALGDNPLKDVKKAIGDDPLKEAKHALGDNPLKDVKKAIGDDPLKKIKKVVNHVLGKDAVGSMDDDVASHVVVSLQHSLQPLQDAANSLQKLSNSYSADITKTIGGTKGNSKAKAIAFGKKIQEALKSFAGKWSMMTDMFKTTVADMTQVLDMAGQEDIADDIRRMFDPVLADADDFKGLLAKASDSVKGMTKHFDKHFANLATILKEARQTAKETVHSLDDVFATSIIEMANSIADTVPGSHAAELRKTFATLDKTETSITHKLLSSFNTIASATEKGIDIATATTTTTTKMPSYNTYFKGAGSRTSAFASAILAVAAGFASL